MAHDHLIGTHWYIDLPVEVDQEVALHCDQLLSHLPTDLIALHPEDLAEDLEDVGIDGLRVRQQEVIDVLLSLAGPAYEGLEELFQRLLAAEYLAEVAHLRVFTRKPNGRVEQHCVGYIVVELR